MLETIDSCLIRCENRCLMKCGKNGNSNLSFYCCVSMVEINTIASGFGHLGPSSRKLQRWRQIQNSNLKIYFFIIHLHRLYFCIYIKPFLTLVYCLIVVRECSSNLFYPIISRIIDCKY
jgi:hypothetical protein